MSINMHRVGGGIGSLMQNTYAVATATQEHHLLQDHRDSHTVTHQHI